MVAGKYMALRSEVMARQRDAVKVILKDLPLHSVSNEQVLESLKVVCQVDSEVHYSNVWFEGKPLMICNGDRFVYIASHKIEKLPATLEVDSMMSQIFKPIALTKCKYCGQTGHQLGDTKCPAKAPDTIMDEVEAFRRLGNPLSNLHICEHGCEIKDKGMSFLLSEHHYQYKKLQCHDLGEESVHLVMETDLFKVMKQAKELLPDDKISDD